MCSFIMIQFSDSFIRFIFFMSFSLISCFPLCHFLHDFHHLMMFVRFKSLFDVVNVDSSRINLICNVSLLSDCHIGCLFACDLIKCVYDCHLDRWASYIQLAHEWGKKNEMTCHIYACVRAYTSTFLFFIALRSQVKIERETQFYIQHSFDSFTMPIK